MKKLIFASILLCFVINARAQTQQQIDSTTSLWVRANIPPSYGASGIFYLSPDSSWGYSVDSGSMISTDMGIDWSPIHRYIPGIITVMRNAQEGYSIGGGWVYKTSDAWKSLDSVSSPPMNGLNSACIADSLHAFMCGGNDIGRTTDGGNTWTKTSVPGFVGWIEFANSSVGYAVGGDPSYVFTTSNSGNTWIKINTGIVAGTLDSQVTGIAVIDPHTVIISRLTTIYRTTDDGNHWKLSVVPTLNPQTQGFSGIAMYGSVGYVVGVPGLILRSNDSGHTWTQEASGLLGAVYLISPTLYGDTLAACAGDSGIILIRRTNSSVVSVQPSSQALVITAFPNPSQESISFQYTLPTTQYVTLTIFDERGRLLASVLQDAMQNMGTHSVQINTTNLASGQYYYQLLSQQYSANGSFTVIHA